MAAGASLGGPAGAVIGAAVGAVAGGLTGGAIATAVDPTVEDNYWRDNFRNRPYVKAGGEYGDYRDAYRYGWESRAKTHRAWDDTANDLERGWDKAKAKSSLAWSDAKGAVRDGWHHVERALPGDADGDGR